MLGLLYLAISLSSLSFGPAWLLSWSKKNDVKKKWNVVSNHGAQQDLGSKDEQKSNACMDHNLIHNRLVFSNLSCSYPSDTSSTDEKTVLKACCGSVSSGSMLALLGPSGSGKSTLLDILAGRKTTGVIKGQVRYNGQPLDKSLVSYVPQQQDFPPSITLSEGLSLVASLVMPLATSSERNHRMEEVLGSFGLLDVRETLIGGWLPGGLSIKGLSGGEKKRLSISTGCLSMQDILIIDEPTTGDINHDINQVTISFEWIKHREHDSRLLFMSKNNNRPGFKICL